MVGMAVGQHNRNRFCFVSAEVGKYRLGFYCCVDKETLLRIVAFANDVAVCLVIADD